MEEVALEDLLLNQRIETCKVEVMSLVAAIPLKYSSWPQVATDQLRESAGIYHFFEKVGHTTQSLYIGKAGYGAGQWNLYKRLSQHFQPSQKNTLIGKIAKASNQDPAAVKSSLCNTDVYLQWVAISKSTANVPSDLETNLVWLECFCKSILKPRYTDA